MALAAACGNVAAESRFIRTAGLAHGPARRDAFGRRISSAARRAGRFGLSWCANSIGGLGDSSLRKGQEQPRAQKRGKPEGADEHGRDLSCHGPRSRKCRADCGHAQSGEALQRACSRRGATGIRGKVHNEAVSWFLRALGTPPDRTNCVFATRQTINSPKLSWPGLAKPNPGHPVSRPDEQARWPAFAGHDIRRVGVPPLRPALPGVTGWIAPRITPQAGGFQARESPCGKGPSGQRFRLQKRPECRASIRSHGIKYICDFRRL